MAYQVNQIDYVYWQILAAIQRFIIIGVLIGIAEKL